jgi:hypothetical protein
MNQVYELLNEICALAITKPLSEVMVLALELGHRAEDEELVKWASLELNGYFSTNPALTEDVIVPEYRTVAGLFSDEYGRPFIIPDPKLYFVNERRIREGVNELERYAKSSEPIKFVDTTANDIIRQYFNVNVVVYTLTPGVFDPILSSIRTELLKRISDLRKSYGKGFKDYTKGKDKVSTSTNLNIGNFQGIIGNVQNSTVTQELHMAVAKGDFDSLSGYLRGHAVSEEDIDALKQVLAVEPQVLDGSGNFGEKTGGWIGKMVQKAATGGWQVGVGVAGTLLAKAISSYYGLG